MSRAPVQPQSPPPPVADNPDWQRELGLAKQRRRRIDRAAAVAGFNGWTAAVLAALSAPFAIFDVSAVPATLVLAVVAFVELRGRAMLRNLDLRAPKILAANQIGLAVLVIAYAVWQLIAAGSGQDEYSRMIAQMPELAPQLSPIGDLVRDMEVLVYVSLIVGTILLQGGIAWYYWSRRRHLDDYIAKTPAWALDVLRAAA